MVKGINRQVIVVKSPDPKLFDQAIFLLREDAFSNAAASPEQVIRQARQAADGYLRKNTVVGRAAARLSPVACGAVGAALASAVWVVGVFVF
ncbi:MAG: translation initiation factor 2 [Oscillospiraceae bacterium]|nr:translation initiation factor 2 [Oscillospiraceae bacterium]